MYVCTFYSFKGGVGRTQALVNVGVELAQRGKRVLLVDFDLEAPGVHTFFPVTRKSRKGGLVEYVTDFVANAVAPDVRDYVSEITLGTQIQGALLLMPAGNPDAHYSRRLSSIDWANLYAANNGYLLFEDLKLQWRQLLNVDYVLVDSRTGHTDVGGICTRQLPDAVTIMFFPNDQNLQGLAKVVADVREEADGARKKRIDILFVMANVPDLDDEDGILQRWREGFAKALGYERLTATIHRYDSLALLDQVIFTLRRRSTRLAKQFVMLTERIMRLNVLDRLGALAFMEGVGRGETGLATEEIETRLEKIAHAHDGEVEVIHALANLRWDEARFEEALPLLSRLVESENIAASILLRRAEVLLMTGRTAEASLDIDRLLNSTATEQEVTRAIRLLRQSDREAISTVGEKRAVQELSVEARLRLAAPLVLERSGQRAAVDIYRTVLQDESRSREQDMSARDELAMALIGLGDLEGALRETVQMNGTSIRSAFNRAMADWGVTRHPNPSLFREVLTFHHASPQEGANYEQCIAIAFALTGDPEQAMAHVHAARNDLSRSPRNPFSCWRYDSATLVEFTQDLDEVIRLISGEAVLPLFVRTAQSGAQVSARIPPSV